MPDTLNWLPYVALLLLGAALLGALAGVLDTFAYEFTKRRRLKRRH